MLPTEILAIAAPILTALAVYWKYIKPMLAERKRLIRNIFTSAGTSGVITGVDGPAYMDWDWEITLNEQGVYDFVAFSDWKPIRIIHRFSRDSRTYEVTVRVPMNYTPIGEFEVDVRRWWRLYRLTARKVLPHPSLRVRYETKRPYA